VKWYKTFSEIENVDLDSIEGFLTPWKPLNRKIGKIRMGETTLITGRRFGGKSSAMHNIALSAIKQDFPVALYSGEMHQWFLKYTITCALLGPDNLGKRYCDIREKDIPVISDDMQLRADELLDGKLFIYSGSDNKDTSIRSTFTDIERNEGARVFIIDNLRTTRLVDKTAHDRHQQVENFIGRLVEKSHRSNPPIHIFLIDHPRKSEQGSKSFGMRSLDDVEGTGAKGDLVDNGYEFRRVGDDERVKLEKNCKRLNLEQHKIKHINAAVKVHKDRLGGSSGTIYLAYDPFSRRLGEIGLYGGHFDYKYVEGL
jgi:hypothetical protein